MNNPGTYPVCRARESTRPLCLDVTCNAKQRERIRYHLHQRGIKSVLISEEIQPFLQEARLTLPGTGRLDVALRSISFSAAARLIRALQPKH